MKEKTILFAVDEKLKREIKAESSILGVSIKSFLTDLVKDYFAEKVNKKENDGESQKIR